MTNSNGRYRKTLSSLGVLGLLLITSAVVAAPPRDYSSKDSIYDFFYPNDWLRSQLEVGDLIVYFWGTLNCAGGNLAVDYRVQNALGDPVQQTFRTLVTVNGQQHPALDNPHETFGPFYGGQVVGLSTFSPGPGTYTVEVEVDFEHVAVEVNENNNTVSAEVVCTQ